MAVGVMVMEEANTVFPAKMTKQVFFCSIIAACGGLMFGYDIGISGGVTGMDSFLQDFFPHVYTKKHRVHENNYCKFDDHLLQFFTSSLYIAGLFASLTASYFCKKWGRKPIIVLASIFFLAGAILNYFARDIYMLIGGRILLGFGVGFGNQTVPLFITEIAPAQYRGALNLMFQLLITVGILGASVFNYFASKWNQGWRYSLGGAAVPALILFIGSVFIYETPASLIERGQEVRGKEVLKKIRGVEDVELEFQTIKQACETSKLVKSPFKELFCKRENRPALICGTLLQFFQQFTGINVVMFYAPVLFQTMGSATDSSLLSSVVTYTVNAFSTIVAVFLVDRIGRKCLLMFGATLMAIIQCTIGGILLVHLGLVGAVTGHCVPVIVLVLICGYVSGFAWSWGPLGWLVPSEIFPLEVRNPGYFCAVGMNMICTFFIGQFFLSALCRFRSYLFFFFGGMNVLMGLFTILFLPETKGVPLDEMADRRWRKHSVWKKFF